MYWNMIEQKFNKPTQIQKKNCTTNHFHHGAKSRTRVFHFRDNNSPGIRAAGFGDATY